MNRETLPTARELIAGHPVDAVSMTMAVSRVVERAMEGRPGAYVCLTNAHTTVESQRSPELRAAASGAFLSVPDGMPLAWVLRRRGHALTEKITGIEFMPAVAVAGVDVGLRHFFYGSAPGVAEAAAARLVALVPGTIIAGALTPPFGEDLDRKLEELRAELAAARPHVLWVGLGAPKQELWMARVAGRLEVPVMAGVGAAFDFLAGTKRPAPRYLRHIGLEWLFRFVSEPRRLWRRYLVGNAEFLFLLGRHALADKGPRR